MIRGGALHEGAPRRLVHRLKYQSVLAAAEPLAELVAPHIPDWATGLVPVPRSLARRLRYGVDPARQLARRLGRLTGLPVLPVLRAPTWWPRHAGAGHSDRPAVRFRIVSQPVPTHVLVDDVVTTGSTLLSGRRAMLGIPTLAVAATVGGRVTTGSEPSPIRR
jgi:predicted amidophosphoribosyltransferase